MSIPRLLPSLGVSALALVLAPALVFANGDVQQRRSAIVQAVELARPAVVTVRTNLLVPRTWYGFFERPSPRGDLYERDGGLGSGVIFHPRGFVITNAHVIARASKIFVHLHGGGQTGDIERRAMPVAVDIPNDLAILRIVPEAGDEARTYPALSLGRSNDLMLGETIIALGFPFRLGLTVTTGIVSGLNRGLRLGNTEFNDFLQVDAAINPGNSGGPLLDVTGRWVGVNTAIYNRALGAEGIGFAIPADRVRSLIARALKRRLLQPDWIGLEIDEGAQGEARITQVYPSGPARRAGLREGDVLDAVNGTDTPTLFDFRLALIDLPSGSPIELRVRGAPGKAPPRRITLTPEPVPTDRLTFEELGFVAIDTDAFDGVRVVRVRPSGPSARIGLQRGHVIVALGRWKVTNTDDLLRFVELVQPGDLVEIHVRAAGAVRDWRPGVAVGLDVGVLRAE